MSIDPSDVLHRVEEIEKFERERTGTGMYIDREQIRFLCQELRTALQDTQRIDFLEHVAVANTECGEGECVLELEKYDDDPLDLEWSAMGHTMPWGYRKCEGATLRAAVDAAMQATDDPLSSTSPGMGESLQQSPPKRSVAEYPGVSYGYVIEGVPVSGKNHMQPMVNRKTGKRFMKIGDVAQAWQDEAISQLAKQRLASGARTLDGPVFVQYVAYQPWDRCDIDNMESALFDALKKALVIRDDNLIVDHRGRKDVDKARPRFEVFVTPISHP